MTRLSERRPSKIKHVGLLGLHNCTMALLYIMILWQILWKSLFVKHLKLRVSVLDINLHCWRKIIMQEAAEQVTELWDRVTIPVQAHHCAWVNIISCER